MAEYGERDEAAEKVETRSGMPWVPCLEFQHLFKSKEAATDF